VNCEILLLGPTDAHRLEHVATDVFDEPIDRALTEAFLNDPRHHLVVAIAGDVVVGFVSAVHYVHPDKPPELWINEVGVAPSHHRQGIGQALMRRILQHGRALNCGQAWVLTEFDNSAARALYGSVGGMEAAAPALLIEFPLSDA
jgi:ribosomal protein S18 acetylase RimI-like enzyme